MGSGRFSLISISLIFTKLRRVTVLPESHIQGIWVRKTRSYLGSATNLVVDLGKLLRLIEPCSLTIEMVMFSSRG